MITLKKVSPNKQLLILLVFIWYFALSAALQVGILSEIRSTPRILPLFFLPLFIIYRPSLGFTIKLLISLSLLIPVLIILGIFEQSRETLTVCIYFLMLSTIIQKVYEVISSRDHL